MIISHSHRYIFIKSEKTAGTSVEAALSKHCTDNDMVTPLGDYWFNRDERGRMDSQLDECGRLLPARPGR